MITPSSSSSSSSIHLLFFLSLFILCFIHGGDSIRVSNDLIHKTCKKAAKGDPNFSYKFCVTSLKSVPKSHNTNLRGLGLISMNLTKTNATHIMASVKKLLKVHKAGMDPFYKDCLETCLEVYSSSIDSIEKAIDYYKDKHYLDANVQISAAMDYSVTCEDGFSEKKGLKSPLTKKNKDMFRLTAMDLSIIEMLR